MTNPHRSLGHIRLTSHSGGVDAPPIRWGAGTAAERGPIIGTTATRAHRNVIGTHSGSYSVYRALAVAAGALSREHRADLTDTSPTDAIGPYPQWGDPSAIVSLDPWGASVAESFPTEIAAGVDIRPTIAVTKAHVILPEVTEAIASGRLVPDGSVLLPSGAALVTKAAVEPVWHLPGVAARFGCSEAQLRRVLFEETGGMYPELVTRADLEVFLPPIGGRNTSRSARVTSSGYIPPVSSNRTRRNCASLQPNRAATPGRCQTGSTAALVTSAAPLGNRTLPSGTSRPLAMASVTSGRMTCALVTAMVGRMSTPAAISVGNDSATEAPQGSRLTMADGSPHCG